MFSNKLKNNNNNVQEWRKIEKILTFNSSGENGSHFRDGTTILSTLELRKAEIWQPYKDIIKVYKKNPIRKTIADSWQSFCSIIDSCKEFATRRFRGRYNTGSTRNNHEGAQYVISTNEIVGNL